MVGTALPETIGSYRIIDLLGEGGMGRVYRAEQVALGREVALKVLPARLSEKEGFRDRFLREVRVLAGINHPNVVTCFDAGEADGRLYMALELVAGGDAADLLKQHGALAQRRALEIIYDCACGLEAIEEAGLIHRDIKPANIFITNRGNAKLADLGLARSASGGERLTDPGRPLGTPSYMSPEQAIGAADIGIASDIFALGAALYALLAGGPPFTGRNPIEVIRQVVNEAPPALAKRAPEVDERIVALVERCMEKAVADRFPSAKHLREALAGVLQAVAGGVGRTASDPELRVGTDRTPTNVATATTTRVASDDERSQSSRAVRIPTPPGGEEASGRFATLGLNSDPAELLRRIDRRKLQRLIKRIHRTEDGLQAWMNLAPGASMPRVLLQIVLESAGIVHGVLTPAVISASRPSQQPRRLILATGDPPFPGLGGKAVTGEVIPPLANPVIIKVEDDAMSAWAYVQPGQMVSQEQAQQAIRQSGVRYGILKENLDRLWQGPPVVSGRLCIARGYPASSGRVEGFALASAVQSAGEQGLAPVEIGDVIAEWVEAEPPVKGMNVLGQVIEPRVQAGLDPDNAAGEGCELQRDHRGILVLTARRAGHCQRRPDGVFRVIPAMEIAGDIGPDSPAVDTDDLVVVRGHVLPGAKITSASDVVIMGDLQDAVIEAGGCIEVQGDVVAGESPVVAGEGIIAHGRVQRQVVAGSLRITGTLDHCDVIATGDVEVHRVIGGSIVAGGNLIADVAGDDLATTTELWAGHQPGMVEQRRIAELTERQVSTERQRVLVDLQERERELQALRKRNALMASAAYTRDGAVDDFNQRLAAIEKNRRRLDERCREAQQRLAEQRRASKDMQRVTDNPDAHLQVRVTAHRGLIARLANADPLVLHRDQKGLDLRLDDGDNE